MKIILMMAMTADGKIAKTSDHFPDWTSKEDKKYFFETTKKHGAVLMGEKTFLTLAPKPKNNASGTASSERDNAGSFGEGPAFPKPLPDRLNVVFTLEKNPPEQENVKWVSGEPEKVLEELEKMGYKSAILGGGAYLNTQFLKKKLIDEIWLTIEPKIFGDGLGIFGGDFDQDLKLISFEKINENSVVAKYKVVY
ncbi:MAG: dihydrofolate reductase family protein [Candidatus Moranbacteria bacterium]|nr:dihydrofolate reductase family protein [Candidatus Moranbacteria bacterium]